MPVYAAFATCLLRFLLLVILFSRYFLRLRQRRYCCDAAGALLCHAVAAATAPFSPLPDAAMRLPLR